MKRARRRQTLDEIRRLRTDLDDWYAEKTAEDRHDDGSPRGQYRTQLAAIYAEVKGAAESISADVENVDVSAATLGAVYDRCAAAERQTVWLWRVWHFFREKFDQRRDARYRDVLKAADEVVWSCYRPFFLEPVTQHLDEPAPLPYVEADYSPTALRRHDQRVLEKKRAYRLVEKAFEQLPVPILKVPITAVGNPWALVLVGHETGHFIQPLVQPELAFRKSFGQALSDAVAEGGGSQADQTRWNLWSEEIFADWYSILTMGPWAIWALAQFEIGDDNMAVRRDRYPAPAVRLALMGALADHLMLQGQEMLEALGLDPDKAVVGAEDAKRDLSFVPRLVPAVTAPLPAGIGKLDDFLLFDSGHYAENGQVKQWSEHLVGGKARPVSDKLHSARAAAAGAARAWKQVVHESEPTDDRVDELRSNSLVAMRESAAPGVRSAGPEPTPRPDAGRNLATLLAHADDEL